MTITATDGSPIRARDIAAAAADKLADLVKDLEPARREGARGSALAVAQPAESSRVPRNLPRNLTFAAALGLLLAGAVMAAREAVGITIRSEDDLRRFTELKTLGVIPRDSAAGGRPAVLGQRPDEPRAEALRTLRSRLRSAAPAFGPASFLLTSSVRGEGTTLTACGVATALTEDGSRVALVDADLRQPRVHAYLDVGASPGLSDVLAGMATVEDVIRESGNRRLWVLPGGEVPPNGVPGEGRGRKLRGGRSDWPMQLAEPKRASTAIALPVRMTIPAERLDDGRTDLGRHWGPAPLG